MKRLGRSVFWLFLFTLWTASCQDRPGRFDDEMFWSGPYVLNRHIYYLERYSGRVVILDPADENEPVQEIALGGEDAARSDSADWAMAFVFPEKDRIVFVSEAARSFHILDDENGEILWTVPDLPKEFSHFAFSPDGRWMVGFRPDTEWDSAVALSGGADGRTLTAESYAFNDDASIVVNSHMLMLMDLESGAAAYPSLKKNDVPIERVLFTGPFLICAEAETCGALQAEEMERVLILGRSRLWILDPNEGADARADVIPLSMNAVYRATGSRISGNMDDEPDKDGGVDDRESLFLFSDESADVVAVNLLYDRDEDRLGYSINKLGLPFAVRDILPYRDGGKSYLLALSGSRDAAVVNVDSAAFQTLSLPIAARSIHPRLDSEGRPAPVLYGNAGLVMAKLTNLAVLWEKNLTVAALGFYPQNLIFTEDGQAVAVDETHLAVVDLASLEASDLDAVNLELTRAGEDRILDAEKGRLYLLGLNYSDDEIAGRLSMLTFGGGGLSEKRVDVKDPAGSLYLMQGAADGEDRLVVPHEGVEGYLSVIRADGGWARTYRGFLLDRDLF